MWRYAVKVSIWTIPFRVNTDASDKQLSDVISQNNIILPSSHKIEQANIVTTLLMRRNLLL